MSSVIVTLLEDSELDSPGSINLSLNLGGDIAGSVQSPNSLNARLNLGGDMTGTVRLALSTPAPVLNNLTPFKKGCVPRLLADGSELGIYSFTLEAPKQEIGTKL